MYPAYNPLPPTSKAERTKSALTRKLRRVKKLDFPLVMGINVLLLLMGLVVLSLGVTAHIKVEENEDAGLEGQIVTDLKTVTISLTALGAFQTAQSIFALLALGINKFPLLVTCVISGALAMAGNIATAGYAFYCREETNDYVLEHKSCKICDVANDVTYKYALPGMSIAMVTAFFHAISFVMIYRVVKYAYRRSQMKTTEKLMKSAFPRKYIRPPPPGSAHWASSYPAAPPMSSFYPPPFQYPPSPPPSYMGAYPQMNVFPYGAGHYSSSPVNGDVERGMHFPGYSLGGLNNFMLPDGTTIQENFYQPTDRPKSDAYTWRSRKVPPHTPLPLASREMAEDARSIYAGHPDGGDIWHP